MSIEIKLDSIVNCSHLSIEPEGDDEYTIGDPALGEFIRVPVVAVDVIGLLNGKNTICQVKEIVDRKYTDDVDVMDFVHSLQELNLIYEIDGHVFNSEIRRNAHPVLRKLGEIFFSKIGLAIYTISLFMIAGMLITDFSLAPKYQDMFIFESVGLSGITLLVVSGLLTVVHELGHLLAASKENVPAKIRLNLRMIFLVAETDMTPLWSKPKNRRYIPFVAGMAWDVVIVLICLLVQIFVQNEMVLSFARMVSLLCIYGFLWQFIIFLRTDIYYVLSNWRNTSNMHKHGMMFLRKKLLYREVPEWDGLPPHEKLNASWFGMLYCAGGAIYVGLFLYFQIPALLYVLRFVYLSLAQFAYDQFLFWDALIVLIVLTIQAVLWAIGYKNSRVQRRQERFREA